MITSTTRSRAAILCFGGWGLQLMLHLAPRLRAVQEQRQALDVAGPDLTRVTRFATLLPSPFLDREGRVPFHLRMLAPDAQLPPFYLDKLLARLPEKAQDEVDSSRLTQAERRVLALLQAAEAVLQPLSWHARPRSSSSSQPVGEGQRVTRLQAFQEALREGAPMARLLETHLVDPVRQDALVPGDPFVQTTLYVVAPLYEPLASAVLWPVTLHLLNQVGRRHLTQVVGIFATGSYARDASRPLENASAYAALAELELLAGLRANEPGQSALIQGMVQGGAEPEGLLSQVGEAFFDRIYLVDREKSNQGLAQDSQELTELVGNVLESFIVADGGQFVQDQVGIDLRDPRRYPYSLLGASTDYVPLEYIFQAVQEQEEKRLARELILEASGRSSREGQEVLGDSGMVDPDLEAPISLADLGAAQSQVLTQLVLRLPDLFVNMTPEGIGDLEVHPDFVMPAAVSAQLRNLSSGAWQAAYVDYLREASHRFEVVAGEDALDEAWGLTALDEQGRPLLPGDDRLLPATATQMRETLVALLASRPDGLLQARLQLRTWLGEVEAERQRLLKAAMPGVRRLAQAQRQLALRNWRLRYFAALSGRPSLAGAFLRPTLLILAIALLSTLYMVAFQRPWDWMSDGAFLLGIGLGAYLASFVAYRRRLSLVRRLRRERVRLAQEELTDRLQERVRVGLIRVYEHLANMLWQMSHVLDDTLEELQQWSVESGPPPLPPSGVRPSHVYRPFLDRALWERCRDYLRGQQDRRGRRSEERLLESWGEPRWRQRLRRLLLGEEATEEPLAEALVGFVQQTIHQAVAPVSVETPSRSRADLIRVLAREYNIEHLLWHSPDEFREADPVQRTRSNGRQEAAMEIRGRIHRYLEFTWRNAKPSANVDLADRMAAHGIPVDFAAVSGRPDSELPRSVLHEFRLAQLVTYNPFSITVVRTLHGLSLPDIGAVHRYREEMKRLSAAEQAAILLARRNPALVYDVLAEDSSVGQMWQ